ncbi:MAG: hypothetical protein QNL71_12860 [Akkermansiaceae bacterium]
MGAGTNPIVSKNGLESFSFYSADPADDTELIMGLGNTQERMGMFWWSFLDITAGSDLPETIQAGTYTFELTVGGDSTVFASAVGGIDLTSADVTPNTDAGLIAGFFSTFENASAGTSAAARSNAELSKDHMYTEFNNLSGVLYTPPTEAAPPTGTGTTDSGEGWTTWTFTWDVAPSSPVIGTNPNFAIYTKGLQGVILIVRTNRIFLANRSARTTTPFQLGLLAEGSSL